MTKPMKICNKCKQNKLLDCFSKDSSSKDGKCRRCKECTKSNSKKWYQENTERHKTRCQKRYIENPEKVKAINSAWKHRNLDRYKNYVSFWAKNNPEKRKITHSSYAKRNKQKCANWAAAYRARKLRATPIWFGEFDDLVMTEAYDLSRLRKDATGFEWHVDHMIPLKSKTACGLHVWNNIQVIPQEINESKNNRMIFTSPLDWLKSIN